MVSYLGYWWVVPALVAGGRLIIGTRQKHLSLALARLLAMLGPTDGVRRRAFEVLRLESKDAGHITSYLLEPASLPPAATTACSDQKTLGRKALREIEAARTPVRHPRSRHLLGHDHPHDAPPHPPRLRFRNKHLACSLTSVAVTWGFADLLLGCSGVSPEVSAALA